MQQIKKRIGKKGLELYRSSMASDDTNQQLEQLRHLQLAQHGKVADDHDHDVLENTDSGTCCERVSWWLNTTLALQSFLSCVSTILTNSYDLITILISIADVSTDIWVIYKFKNENRNTFFIIALVVMILAQLSYAIAFMMRFNVKAHGRPYSILLRRRLCLFLMILPLTPVISFIFYWCTVYPKNCFLQFMKTWLGVRDELEYTVNENQAPMLVWIEKKINKHIGFILEGFVLCCVVLFCFAIAIWLLLFVICYFYFN